MIAHRLKLFALLALIPAGGCYHYAPTPSSTPEPGAGVRVHLAEPRSFDVSGFTAHDVRRVDGSVMERRPDEWVLAADALHAVNGTRFDAGAWAVSIPPQAFDRVEVRRFSAWRTAAAGVIAAVAIYLGSEALQGSSSTPGGDPNGGGGGRSVIPLP